VKRRELFTKLLSWGLWGGLAGSVGWIFGDVWLAAGRFSTVHWSPVINLNQLPGDGAIPFPRQRIALIRRGNHLAALSLECTHLGCLVNVVDQGFFCPCHGSEFGPLGELYSGPATRSLPWHHLRVQDGRVWVQTGSSSANPDWLALASDPRSEVSS